jgi:hypothetical protein
MAQLKKPIQLLYLILQSILILKISIVGIWQFLTILIILILFLYLKISDMPKNKVQVFIDPDFIGNPPSFNYIVSVMVRVNNTFLDKPPDYLVDSAPDNNNELFWIRWFSR